MLAFFEVQLMPKAKHFVTVNSLLALKPCPDGRRMIRREAKLRGYGPDTQVPVLDVIALINNNRSDMSWVLAALDEKSKPKLRRAVVETLRPIVKADYFFHAVVDVALDALARGNLAEIWPSLTNIAAWHEYNRVHALLVGAVGALLVLPSRDVVDELYCWIEKLNKDEFADFLHQLQRHLS